MEILFSIPEFYDHLLVRRKVLKEVDALNLALLLIFD
jgi:hypothetical protein